MYRAGLNNPNTNKKGECDHTVYAIDGCYKTWAVNYILWGRINELCDNIYLTTRNDVIAYRYVMPGDPSENEDKKLGTLSREAWTALGYIGFDFDETMGSTRIKYRAAFDTSQLRSNYAYKNCAKSEKKYNGSLTLRLRYSKNEHFFLKNDGKSEIKKTKGISDPSPSWK